LTTDTLGLIKPPNAYGLSGDFYKRAFALDPPYTTYYTQATSIVTGPSAQLCNSTTGPYIGCPTVMTFKFGSLAASTMTSIPGNEKLDIWLNAGAIVGAVQFFAWFLGIFNV
jgi:hypothetical protein